MPDKKPKPMAVAPKDPNEILLEKARNKKKAPTTQDTPHPQSDDTAPMSGKTNAKSKAVPLRELVTRRFDNGAPMFYKLESGEIVCSKKAPTDVKKQFYLNLYKNAHKALEERAKGMNADELLASDIPQQQSFAKAYAFALSALSASDYSQTHYIAFHSRTEGGWMMFLLPNALTALDVDALHGPFFYVNDDGKVFLQESAFGPSDVEGTVFASAMATMEHPEFPLPFRNRPIQPGERLAQGSSKEKGLAGK